MVRGIISVDDCVKSEEKYFKVYVRNSKERLLNELAKGLVDDESRKEYKKRVNVC